MTHNRTNPHQDPHLYKCDSRCKCGRDPGHEEHDKAYLRGELSAEEYAQKVGGSKWGVLRHVNGHLPETLLKATGIQAVARADSLLDQLKEAREKALMLLDKAEKGEDLKAAGLFLREIREQIRLMAELEGRLSTQPQVNILINPQWIELRTMIIKALEPYPEAKEAVVSALP